MPKRRSRKPARQYAVLQIVGGALIVVVGLALVVAAVPGWAARGAYRNAAPDLRRAVVFDTRKATRFRSFDEYRVTIQVLGDDAERRVELPDPEPVFSALRRGSEVTVRVWRGHVSRFYVDGVGTAETADSPLVQPLDFTAFGGWAVAWGGFFAYVGAQPPARRRFWQPASPAERLLMVAVVTVVVPPFHVHAFDVYEPLPVLLTFLGLTGALWGLLELAAARRR